MVLMIWKEELEALLYTIESALKYHEKIDEAENLRYNRYGDSSLTKNLRKARFSLLTMIGNYENQG